MKNKILLLIIVATLGLTTATMAQVPSFVPTNGLVGYWPFNGNANDESGNGNNGTVNGATLTSDRNGNANSAYDFNGQSEISCSFNGVPSGNVNRTLNLWIKSNNINQVNKMLAGYGNDSPLEMFALIMYNPSALGKVAFWARDNDTPFLNSINLNVWTMFSVVYNNDTVKLYENGILILANNYSFIPLITPQSSIFYIGNFNNNVTGFDGQIDDVALWNRVLTQQEITDLYNSCQLSVSTQPASQTININNNAQFIVGSSDTNATYQWQTDLGLGFQNISTLGQYSGTTNDTLSVANVAMNNDNQLFRCIINSGSCTDTSNVAVLTINSNVGIHEMAQHNLFSVFPNPAHNIINVKADHKLIGSVFTIYDNTGKAVQSGKINAANTTIELSNLSGGVYLFSIGDNMKQTFKLIKE
jgi:hypothetical protein